MPAWSGMEVVAKRVRDASNAAFLIGDCAFDNPVHHGTPNQRRASVEWGIGLTAATKKQGKVNSSETMLSLFDDRLPTILAPAAD